MSRNFMFSWHFDLNIYIFNLFLYPQRVGILQEIHNHMTDCLRTEKTLMKDCQRGSKASVC